MAGMVLDVSVALTWCFEDEMTQDGLALLRRVRSTRIVVPALWHVEVANALLQGQRRNRIDAAAVDEFPTLLGNLLIETDHDQERRGSLAPIALAQAHRLTAYDACYLELALRLGLPLASHDSALREAASAAGGDVIQA
jgi:predicted nucleic acid-binding protein